MSRHTRAHIRGAVATTTALGIAIGLCAAVTSPALAAGSTQNAATDEVVIPNPGRFQPRGEDLGQVGATGYAHKQEGSSGWVWTDFATGAGKAITEEQATKGHSGLFAAIEQDPAVSVDHVKVRDVATGEQRLDVLLPQGRYWTGAYDADTVVTASRGEFGYDAVQLLRIVDGEQTEVASFGLGESFQGRIDVLDQDSRGALLTFYREGDQFPKTFLVDYAAGTLKGAPGSSEGRTVQLGTEQILTVDHTGSTDSVWFTPRTAPTAPPVVTPVEPPQGNVTGFAATDVIGEWALLVRPLTDGEKNSTTGAKLQAVRRDTGEVKDLLPHAAPELSPAPDGSILAVGGTGADDWAVHRVALGEGGKPTLTTVRKIPAATGRIDGLALGGGRLNFLSDDVYGVDALGLHDVDTDLTTDPATAGATSLRARILAPTAPGVVSLGDGDAAHTAGKRIHARIDAGNSRTADLPVADATAIDAAGNYVLAQQGTTKYVADLDNDGTTASDVKLTIPNSTAAALWDAKVWKAAATPGQIDSYNLRTGSTSAPIDIKSGCKPTELQAVNRWIYWACGTDKAGVYDLGNMMGFPVATGDALLGDGFVVHHVADELQATEVLTGRTFKVADLAEGTGSGRRSTWTVDKFGGGVAFVDGQKNIRVKKVGVVTEPLTALQHTVKPLVFTGGGVEPKPATWSPVFRFSKPVGSWELTVRRGNGEAVRTITGTGGTGAAVRPSWDGKDGKGRGLESAQYRWELTARPLDGRGVAQGLSGTFMVTGSNYTTLPGTYTPVAPARLLDTRSGLGAPKAKVGPLGTVALKVAGRGGVPAEGVGSVVLNVTATNATSDSFVSVWPYQLPSFASSLNFKAGQTTANLVTVPVKDGYIELFNRNGSVDLLADVAGYYTEDTVTGSSYEAVTPSRLMDTRTGTGVPKAKLGAGQTVTLSIPDPNVTAVAMNVTATNATATGFVAAYPYGTNRPDVSNLNFTAGQTVPNLVIVPVKDGKVTFYNRAGSVDLIGDVAGYFKQGTGSVFTGMQPMRLMDTRNGTGVPKAKVGAGQTVSLTVGTKYKAVVLNVTATNPTEAGFVSVYPYGTTRTSASNLNFTAGQTVPNGVIVPVKDGKVTFYNKNGSVDLIADVTGHYTG
ncbi:hypothetical protein [Streptomyces sp. NPDC101115]|uniref:hypothetical protein n=1 Tax=Streptomyces sp. NPDC101115 TaxID=3366106 RepID=UPI0038286135